MKDTKKSMLLFVFALGIVLTYVVSLFLPLPYSKNKGITLAKPIKDEVIDNSMMTNTMPSGGGEYGQDRDIIPEDISMQTMMSQMAVSLAGKKDTDFDKGFLEEMITHHEGAVAMAKMALTSTKNPKILELSKQIIASQEKEISDMKLWRQSLAK